VQDIKGTAHRDDAVPLLELCSILPTLLTDPPHHRNATFSVLVVERI